MGFFMGVGVSLFFAMLAVIVVRARNSKPPQWQEEPN